MSRWADSTDDEDDYLNDGEHEDYIDHAVPADQVSSSSPPLSLFFLSVSLLSTLSYRSIEYYCSFVQEFRVARLNETFFVFFLFLFFYKSGRYHTDWE